MDVYLFLVSYTEHLHTSSSITSAVVLRFNHCFSRRSPLCLVPAEDRLVHCVYHELVFGGTCRRACAGLHLDWIEDLLLGDEIVASTENIG